MFNYETQKDGYFYFHLVLKNEDFRIENNRWVDDKGHCGSISRYIDYENNSVKFTLSSTKVWKEEISRYYLKGEEMSYQNAPRPMSIEKTKTTVFKVYEIPLREEDRPRQFGAGRLCYYTTHNRGGVLVDITTKRMIAVWADRKACWVKSKDIDVSDKDRFKGMPAYERKMSDFQGFVLENTGTYNF